MMPSFSYFLFLSCVSIVRIVQCILRSQGSSRSMQGGSSFLVMQAALSHSFAIAIAISGSSHSPSFKFGTRSSPSSHVTSTFKGRRRRREKVKEEAVSFASEDAERVVRMRSDRPDGNAVDLAVDGRGERGKKRGKGGGEKDVRSLSHHIFSMDWHSQIYKHRARRPSLLPRVLDP